MENTNTETGVSTLNSFKYMREYVIVTLKNGISGVIGDKSNFPFATMLTMKGQRMQYTKIDGEYNGKSRYSLEFVLE